LPDEALAQTGESLEFRGVRHGVRDVSVASVDEVPDRDIGLRGKDVEGCAGGDHVRTPGVAQVDHGPCGDGLGHVGECLRGEVAVQHQEHVLVRRELGVEAPDVAAEAAAGGDSLDVEQDDAGRPLAQRLRRAVGDVAEFASGLPHPFPRLLGDVPGRSVEDETHRGL
jgi:hypothetical protein